MRVNIGVDVGGTKITVGAVDDNGEILALVRKSTPASSLNAMVDTIGECVKKLVGLYDAEAIGIGAAGLVDRERTTVVFTPNLAWCNEPLAKKTSQVTGYRVVVENDANAAAWGESKFGAASEYLSAAVVIVGAGVGGGIIIDGALLRGVGGFAGGIGHIAVNPGDQRCGCGVLGCWEAQTFGTALVHIACQLAADSPVYGVRMFKLADDREITGLDIIRAAQVDDPAVLERFVEITEWIGIGMITLSAAIDPEVFVLVGGVSELGDLLTVPARTSFEKSLTAKEFRPAPLVKLAALGNNVGIIGATDLVRR